MNGEPDNNIMSAELALPQHGVLTVAPQVSVLDLILKAARDPTADPGKMATMVELYERLAKNQAEVEFNQALARLQPRLPVITKHGRAKFKDVEYFFAKYEDIDDAIRPLLSAEGFSLSFDQRNTDKGVVYSGTLRHASGHKDTKELCLPPDTSGAKNAIQAVGSTVSYAKRYLVGMLLNIVTRGQDDDAHKVGFISDQQMSTIIDLVAALELERNPRAYAKFLEFAEAKTVGEIKARDYDRVYTGLRDRLRAKQQQRAEL